MNILEVKRLTKYFGGVAALKDVSFSVPEGQISGFIGPNGAGKTTLFALITGALKPSSGKVELRGRDVTGMRSFALVRSGIVRTHQVVRPFRAMTVLENVQLAAHFGRRKMTRTEEARKYIQKGMAMPDKEKDDPQMKEIGKQILQKLG